MSQIPASVPIGIGIAAGVVLLIGAIVGASSSAAAAPKQLPGSGGGSGGGTAPAGGTTPGGGTAPGGGIGGSTEPGNGGTTLPAMPQLKWQKATTINPGDPTRIAIAVADAAQIQQTLGANMLAVISSFFFLSSAHPATNYSPGAPLPADWPADDLNPSAEAHAEFVFVGPNPVQVAWLGIPIQVWTQIVA